MSLFETFHKETGEIKFLNNNELTSDFEVIQQINTGGLVRLTATRLGSCVEQDFHSMVKAKVRGQWLSTQGFEVTIKEV